jgi:hypothetical protein
MPNSTSGTISEFSSESTLNTTSTSENASSSPEISQLLQEQIAANSRLRSENKSIRNEIDNLNKVFDQLKQKLQDAESNFKETIVSESDALKKQIFEIVGLFIAIFTFISFEIQILKAASDGFTIVGINLILFGCMLSFVLLVRRLILPKEKRQPDIEYIVLLGVGIIAFILGGVSLIYGDQVSQKDDTVRQLEEEVDRLYRVLQVEKPQNPVNSQLEVNGQIDIVQPNSETIEN